MLLKKTTLEIRKILAALTVPLVLAASAASAADTPSATRVFDKLYAFGDSYTNNGQPFPTLGDTQGYYYPSQWVTPDIFNGPYVALPWVLFRILKMDEKPEAKPTNPLNSWTEPWTLSNLSVYGWSGATMTDKARKMSDAFLPLDKPTLSEQVNSALNGYPGKPFVLPPSPKVKLADNDAVLVNFGLSDVYQIAKYYDTPFFRAASNQPYLDGVELAKEAGMQVKRLADAGAKTIVFDAFSGVDFVGATFNYVDEKNQGFLPRANQLAQTYFAALKTELALATANGTKIYLIDMNTFFTSKREQLSYGALEYKYIDGTTTKFEQYEPLCRSGYPFMCGFNLRSALNDEWERSHVLAERLHPSTGGFTVLSQYIAEFLNDPSKLGPASTLITTSEGLTEIATTYGNGVITNARENEIVTAAGSTPVNSDGAITINLDKPAAAAPAQTSKPGTVVVYEDGKYTFDKKIFGNVSLFKTGPGGLTLSGDNDYTGDTHIAESGLAVNGAIQNLIVEKGGAIILNDEAGALKIRGDATFDDQSRIYLKADADGTIDPLKIDGKATMNGPLFNILSTENLDAKASRHTVFSAAGGWGNGPTMRILSTAETDGNFSGFTSYDAFGNVYLTLSKK